MFSSIFQSKSNFSNRGKRKTLFRISPYWIACIPLVAIVLVTSNTAAMAQNAEPLTIEMVQGALNCTWVLVAACLVIFMNAGFAMLEAGFCRRKNVVNVLSKNLLVFALTTVSFWSIGFSIMFSGVDSPFAGNEGFFLSSSNPAVYGLEAYPIGLPISVFFLYQAAFAGTAATIVSGAVAERIQFVSYAIFSLLLTAIAYPVVGHWIFTENGWLAAKGFHDFAGSTSVHSVGGWAALVGAIVLGARKGKYQEDGRTNPMPGHNMSLATLGCFILWLGWFGFNGGSVLAANEAVPYVVLTSSLSAMAGALTATLTSWLRDDQPDLSMIINGILAGFVSISACCYVVDYFGAVIIGAIAGILVVFAISTIDSFKIDDPVGAIPVHLVCGIWGTLAVGLLANPKNLLQKGLENPISGLVYSGRLDQIITQMTGILAVGAFIAIFSLAAWFFVQVVFGLRVPEKAELDGLDISEHGMEAYHGFVTESDAFSGGSVDSYDL